MNEIFCKVRKDFHPTTYNSLIDRALQAERQMIVAIQNESDFWLRRLGA
jgi:hypothetical protein